MALAFLSIKAMVVRHVIISDKTRRQGLSPLPVIMGDY
jgi:hypothetical protein